MVEARETLTPAAPFARFVFRGGGPAMAACSDGFGVVLQRQPLRATRSGERAALWQGPDEWLLLAPVAEAAHMRAAIEAAVVPLPHALVDVSDRQCGFVVAGPRVEEWLAAACPLDLHISAFPPGMTTRTQFAKAEITLWRLARDRFHLEAARSFVPYVTGLLDEAKRGRG
jgi:sarcosine oxidase subunit gamma